MTSFFSGLLNCGDAWCFPCREVWVSFGKGWRMIWVEHWFWNPLLSLAPRGRRLRCSCNPATRAMFDQTRGTRCSASENMGLRKAVLVYTCRKPDPFLCPEFLIFPAFWFVLPQIMYPFLIWCLPPRDICWSLHCLLLPITGAQITFSFVCAACGNVLGKRVMLSQSHTSWLCCCKMSSKSSQHLRSLIAMAVVIASFIEACKWGNVSGKK